MSPPNDRALARFRPDGCPSGCRRPGGRISGGCIMAAVTGRLSSAIAVLVAASLSLALSACGGGDGGVPSVRLVLEADFSQLPAEVDRGAIMTILEDVLERRATEFGVDDVRVEREDTGRASVTMRGSISEEDARQLLGQKARLEFSQPTLDEDGRVVCEAPNGAQFTVSPGDITYVPEVQGERVLPRCAGSEGQSGAIVWIPVDTSGGQGPVGDAPQIPIQPLRAAVERSGAPVVIVAFFPESGARFQKITAGMVGLPLGILLDGERLAAPRVEEPVTTSRVVIGGLSLPRAVILAAQLSGGELPVPVSVISLERTGE